MRPIRVLNLTSTRYGIGGVERLLLSYSRHHDRRAFDVSYCNLFCDADGAGRFPTALRELGQVVHQVPGRRWRDLPGIVAGLARLLRRERFDVLHAHMLQATIVGLAAARLGRTPAFVVTRHFTNDALSSKPWPQGWLDRHAMRSATHVVAIAENTRAELVGHGVVERRITVVHNAIELGPLANGPLDGVPWDPSWERGPLIGTVGGLVPCKGHAVLIEAMARVLEERSDARLVIVGEGPERTNLEGLAARLGIADRVLLAGFRPDAAALMGRVGLYAHPSIHESFGISILEAMAARRAVIATRVGGIPEIVVPGETGLLVPPSDAHALAAAVLQLVRDPAQARRMGEAGRAVVEREFDVAEKVAQMESIYSKILTQ